MRKIFSEAVLYFIFKTWRFGFLVPIFLCLTNPLSASEDSKDTVSDRIIAEESAAQNTAAEIGEKIPGVNVRLVEDGESIESLGEDYYFGIFVNSRNGQQEDMDGVDGTDRKSLDLSIDGNKPVGTLFIVRKLEVNGVPVGIEIDDGLDSITKDNIGEFNLKDSDEATELDDRWLVAAQAGFKRKLEFANVFASGGLAVARGYDSVTGTGLNTSLPDDFDSSSDDDIHLGWVVGLGAEVSLNQKSKDNPHGDKAWILRMEGAYINLEGNNPNQFTGNGCGTDSSPSSCAYNVEDQKIIRFAIVRRF